MFEEGNTRSERREQRKRNATKMNVRGLSSVRLAQQAIMKRAQRIKDRRDG